MFSHIIHSLHGSDVVLKVPLRYKLQDQHHWVGGSDTAKHLEDMWVVVTRHSLHHINLIHEQLFLFSTAVICRYTKGLSGKFIFNDSCKQC